MCSRNTVTKKLKQMGMSLSLISKREKGLIRPWKNSRCADQVHTIYMRKGDSEDFSEAGSFLIYLGRFKMENGQQIWQG